MRVTPQKLLRWFSFLMGKQFKVVGNKYAFRFVSCYILHLEFRDAVLILKEYELSYNFIVLVSLFAQPLENTILR